MLALEYKRVLVVIKLMRLSVDANTYIANIFIYVLFKPVDS